MPRREHLVLCGGIDPSRAEAAAGVSLNLNLHGASANVRLRIADISSRLLTNVPDVLVDLLEVASYVYAADAAVSRGGKSDAQMGASWRRFFRFVIAVRQPDLWSSNAVHGALTETLSFLSDDTYVVEFRHLEKPPAIETYFEFPAPGGDGVHTRRRDLVLGRVGFLRRGHRTTSAQQKDRPRQPPVVEQDF
jgi:hypothetical protein